MRRPLRLDRCHGAASLAHVAADLDGAELLSRLACHQCPDPTPALLAKGGAN